MDASHPVRRTQAQRRSDARLRLIRAAVDLIAEGGVAAVTLPTVGARAGYSRGVTNYHFGTKADLVVAAIEQIEDRFWTTVGSTPLGGSSVDRLARLATTLTAAVEKGSPALRAHVVLWSTAPVDPQLAARMAASDVRFRQLLAEMVERGQAAGEIDPDVHPSAFASMFVALLRGLAIERLIAPMDVELAGAGSELEAFVRRRVEPRL